jgi:hypothetical protein
LLAICLSIPLAQDGVKKSLDASRTGAYATPAEESGGKEKFKAGNKKEGAGILNTVRRKPIGKYLVVALFLVDFASGAIKTGPEVNATIPGFALPDQNGTTQTLASIAGPKGAMLVFYRSADW